MAKSQTKKSWPCRRQKPKNPYFIDQKARNSLAESDNHQIFFKHIDS
jgi:hypothetical protein